MIKSTFFMEIKKSQIDLSNRFDFTYMYAVVKLKQDFSKVVKAPHTKGCNPSVKIGNLMNQVDDDSYDGSVSSRSSRATVK